MMRHCRTQETSSLPRRGRATSSLPSSAQITSTNRPADSSSPFMRSKAEIPVTCGPKKGTLYTDKFSNSEACIFSQGKWFTPSQFEVFGGTRGSKKSRTSIFYHGVPLQILIQDGFLPPTSFKMKTEDVQHAVPGSSPDISNITQRQKRQTKNMGPKKDIAEKQKRKTGKTTRSSGDTRHSKASTEKMEESVGQGVKQNEEEDDEEKEDEEDEEEEEELDLNNDDQCFICNCERNLVYCGSCSRAFHNDCHIPALTTNTHDNKSRERWMCTYCVWRNNQRLWRRVAMTEEQALNSPVSPYILHCEYLLLFTCKKDTHCVFRKDPSTMVRRYRSFISEPMWLDRVKEKLHAREYHTLRQFVCDMRLIFQNCSTFNKDNYLIRTMGSRLNQMFEREFKSVFNIQ